MCDPLDFLWSLVDAPEPIVAASVVASWPKGVFQLLNDLGFLHEAEKADRVLCPECHGHIEEVIAIEGPCGKTRFVIPCPDVMRAEVPSEALRRWSVDLNALAMSLAVSLAVTGKCTELIPSRLWRLGRTKWQEKSRDVLFARGLTWNDGEIVRSTLVRGRKPIVFVPLHRPPDSLWRTLPPLLVLRHVSTLRGNSVDIDMLEVATAIHDTDVRAASTQIASLTKQDLQKAIRQQIKAEGKMSLTEDAYIETYRQCSSIRDAAAFLTQETGQLVTKDQVYGAIKRAGGAAAVLNIQDSDSIVRGVASQRRDKHGKTLLQSQPHKDK